MLWHDIFWGLSIVSASYQLQVVDMHRGFLHLVTKDKLIHKQWVSVLGAVLHINF